MAAIEISLADIADWDSFHRRFATALRFTEDYGANLDAFFDAMCDWTRPDSDGMLGIEVPYDDDLILVLTGSAAFQSTQPDIWLGFSEIVAEINAARLATPREGRLLLCLA